MNEELLASLEIICLQGLVSQSVSYRRLSPCIRCTLFCIAWFFLHAARTSARNILDILGPVIRKGTASPVSLWRKQGKMNR